MKAKDLLKTAKNKFREELEERAIARLMDSLRDIENCKRRLKSMDDNHKRMLEWDLEMFAER